MRRKNCLQKLDNIITYSNSYRGMPDTVSGRIVAKLHHRDGYLQSSSRILDNFSELKHKKLIKVVYT